MNIKTRFNQIFIVLLLFSQLAFWPSILNEAGQAEQKRKTQASLVFQHYPPFNMNGRGDPGILELIIEETFKSGNISISYDQLPVGRAIKTFAGGEYDMYLGPKALKDVSFKNINGGYVNLLRTSEMLFYIPKTKNTGTLSSYKKLERKNVGIVIGAEIAKRKLEPYGPHFITVPELEQTFAMLAMNRVDFVSAPYLSGLYYRKYHNSDNSGQITPFVKPFATFEIGIHFNSKSGKKLQEQFEKGLAQIYANGVLFEIYKNFAEKVGHPEPVLYAKEQLKFRKG